MRKVLIVLLVILTSCAAPKKCCGQFTYKGHEYNVQDILKDQLKHRHFTMEQSPIIQTLLQ